MTRKHPLQPSWSASSHRERFQALAPYFRDRRVLDVGAASGHTRPDWVHAQIAEVAAKVVGIDIDAAGVRAAQDRGYDVRLVDAQAADLGERFEIAFAGELIEHLTDFSGFLDGVRKHLEPDGHLILTTPNAFALSNFVYRVGFRPRVHHEHTCWFCEDTLATLLTRCGFEPVEVAYLPHRTPGGARRLAASAVRAALPERLAWRTMMMKARLLS